MVVLGRKPSEGEAGGPGAACRALWWLTWPLAPPWEDTRTQRPGIPTSRPPGLSGQQSPRATRAFPRRPP